MASRIGFLAVIRITVLDRVLAPLDCLNGRLFPAFMTGAP